jgi:hypothetical protein
VGRLSLAAAIVVLGALAFAGGAQACSCLEMSPRAGLRAADAAIVGRLVEVVPRDRYSAEYRYRVRRVYKGNGMRRGRMISVRSSLDGASCGLPAAVGRRYGLFLGRSDDGWRGSLCGLVDPGDLATATGGAQRNHELDLGSAADDGVSNCAS